MDLVALIDSLDKLRPGEPQALDGWQIAPMSGGRNNLLYHASGEHGDVVVKFTRRDARDRVGREYAGLTLLHTLAPELAPTPLLMNRERWSQPVVAQTWLDGQSRETAPTNAQDWRRLAEHYAAVHNLAREGQAEGIGDSIRSAVLTFPNAQAAVDYVLVEMSQIIVRVANLNLRPTAAGLHPDLPAEVRALALRMEEHPFPTWPEPERVFGRCDPYIANFLQRSDQPWASVDWENSGWVDPAFELGDLMTHPCYRGVTEDAWAGYIHDCLELHPGDKTLGLRMRVFQAIILVRWAGVFARYTYERDHGLVHPERLVQWPPEWWAAVDEQCHYYTLEANRVLDELI